MTFTKSHRGTVNFAILKALRPTLFFSAQGKAPLQDVRRLHCVSVRNAPFAVSLHSRLILSFQRSHLHLVASCITSLLFLMETEKQIR